MGAAERLLCHYNRLFQGDESRERTLIHIEHTPGIDRKQNERLSRGSARRMINTGLSNTPFLFLL